MFLNKEKGMNKNIFLKPEELTDEVKFVINLSHYIKGKSSFIFSYKKNECPYCKAGIPKKKGKLND